MMKREFSFRLAVPEDAAQMLDIYSRYVTETAVTFEYDVPTVTEFENRIRKISERFPWIVCETDGRIVGYAYASEYRERAAFRWSCELSVYVADVFQGHGIGKVLYRVLLDVLRLQGYRTAVACVTYPNAVSDAFHRGLGFEYTGIFPNVGYKLGRWWGVSWYQFALTDYPTPPAEPLEIGEIPVEEILKILNTHADKTLNKL
jgi:phosphinothricin acetyltransferase